MTWGHDIESPPFSFPCLLANGYVYIAKHQLLNPEVLPSLYTTSWTYGFDAIPGHFPSFVLLRTVFKSLFYACLRLLLQNLLPVLSLLAFPPLLFPSRFALPTSKSLSESSYFSFGYNTYTLLHSLRVITLLTPPLPLEFIPSTIHTHTHSLSLSLLSILA
jgi:hypothetical protein